MEYGKKMNVGGFTYLKYKKDEMSFIKVSTIAGDWNMNFREDTKIYAELDKGEDDRWLDLYADALVLSSMNVNPILNRCFQLYVTMIVKMINLKQGVNIPKEEINGLSAEFNELVGLLCEKEDVSDEEDAEILKRLLTEVEMYEELGATLDKEDLTIPTNENVEAAEAWSVKGGTEFEFKTE